MHKSLLQSLLSLGFTITSILAGSSICRGGTQATLPFLTSEFSVFNAEPGDQEFRNVVFTLPDDKLVASLASNEVVVSYVSYGLNTNLYPANQLLYFADCENEWQRSQSTELTNDCSVIGPTPSSGGSGLILIAQMMVSRNPNLQQELSSRIVPSSGKKGLTYIYQDVPFVSVHIVGGSFDGAPPLKLKGTMAYGFMEGTNDVSGYSESWLGDMFLALDWGIDPLGNDEYVLLRFTFTANASTQSPDCISLQEASQYYLGQDTVSGYFQPAWNNLVNQASTDGIYLQGAAPELLVFYDFSGSNTMSVASSLPPSVASVAPATVIALPYKPYTNDFKYINQYDAGPAFGLPFGDGAIGGDACGPMSLTLLLNTDNYTETNPVIPYNNTMLDGFRTNASDGNGFFPDRAKYWLKARSSYATDYTNNAYVNPPPPPANSHTPVDEIWDTVAGNVQGHLADIDNLLRGFKQPLIFRTDLSVGTGTGAGHEIVLLGIGHSDLIAQLYGTSGDYYIVFDPAGNYYADYKHQSHYDKIEELLSYDNGIVYGGWFARYPKELLQKRITRHGKKEVNALTIGAPFGSSVEASAHCPVSFVITDPVGNQTGLFTDGSISNYIPGSYYEDAMSEVDGGETYTPSGAGRTVGMHIVNGGLYKVDIIATNSGAYTFEWQETGSDGTVYGSGSTNGTLNTGDHTNFLINVVPIGAPQLQTSTKPGGMLVYWPTNDPAFVLQSTTANPASNSWAAAGLSSTVTNGMYTVSNSFAGTRKYFRLKK